MKKEALVLVVLCLSTMVFGATTTYYVGDDDGFNTGTPRVPGDVMWGDHWGTPDGDGTDELKKSSHYFYPITFTYDPYTSIQSASLYVQYLAWPESGDGSVWLDYNQISVIPKINPREWWIWQTVRGFTIDLTPYASDLLDGSATFSLVGPLCDDYNIDYAKMTITSVVPVPGAVILCGIGVSAVGWFRRRKMI